MCRMALMWGNIENDFPMIFKSVSDVAMNDPLLKRDSIRGFSHKDGWGYLNISGDSIDYKRYATPLTLAVSPPPAVKGIVMVHARAAAAGEGLGVLNAHPFHSQDEDYDAYITHNGWFDKFKINESLKLKSVNSMNDTEVFLSLVMAQNGTMYDKLHAVLELSRERGYFRGGANIFVAALKRGTKELSIFYHTDIGVGNEYGEYYRLYHIKSEEWQGVVSSSVMLSGYLPKGLKTEVVERGKLVEVVFNHISC